MERERDRDRDRDRETQTETERHRQRMYTYNYTGKIIHRKFFANFFDMHPFGEHFKMATIKHSLLNATCIYIVSNWSWYYQSCKCN